MAAVHPIPRRRGIAVALAATLAASGCAAGGADAASDEPLTVLMISSHEGAANWLAERYEEEAGVELELVIVPYDEIGATLALDQQSGANTIDVAAPWYVSLGDLAADGAIQDLTEWVDDTPEIDVDDFIPSIWEPYTTIDDRLYGLPFDGDTHVLFYNRTILERNGFTEPPTTWDEYLQQVQTITANESANGIYGAAIFGQQSPLILGASYANRLAGYGGAFLDEDGRPALDTPEAIQAAQALVDVNDVALPTPAETDFGAGNSAWFAGDVAFIENWTDLGIRSQDPASGSEVVDQWGVTFLPVGEEGQTSRASLVAGFSWVVAENTDQTDQARDFIEWAASSEVNASLLTSLPPTGIDPNRISSLADETYAADYPEIQAANQATLEDALAWPTGEGATEAAQVLTDELAELLAGTGGTAEETMQRVQEQWLELLGDG